MTEQEECRYEMTPDGMRIREQYVWLLLSAQDAIDLAQWLLMHYVELEKLRRRLEDESKEKGEHV